MAVAHDRLSSLPDELCIRIISLLPTKSAMETGLLSNRWHGLWGNVASIKSFNISSREFHDLQEFLNVLDEFVKQITCIHTFRLDLSLQITFSDWQDSWLRRVCDRNVHVLTLRWHISFNSRKLKFPSFIFRTRSLISLELGSTYDWYFSHDCDQIDLPNLKKLSLDLSFWPCEWLEKLIKSLPSLEDLSLQFRFHYRSGPYIKCSNENLRRLSIYLCSTEWSEVGINAPSLEYLDVASPKNVTFFFEVEPIVLREAKIYIINENHFPWDEVDRLMSSFYKAISNVRNLTLDARLLHNSMSTVFHSAISVTLRVNKMPENSEIIIYLLDLCPQVDVLTLKISDIIWKGCKHREIFLELSDVNPLRWVVTRIDIETDWMSYENPAESFLEFVRCLLSNAMVLKHFQFRVAGHESTMLSVENKRRQELEFCVQLYSYKIASAECEVEFVGRYIEMSYEAGSRDRRDGRESKASLTFI